MVSRAEIRRFSRAALEVAATTESVEAFVQRFNVMAQMFREHRVFRHLVLTRRVPRDQKMRVITETFGQLFSTLEIQLLDALIQDGLALQLPTVVRTIAALARARRGQVQLTLSAPTTLGEGELAALKQSVERGLNRPVTATAVTEPELVGGIKLRVGNILVDGSAARRLEGIRAALLPT